MEELEIKIKLLSSQAKMPTKGTEYSAGFDMYGTSLAINEQENTITIGTDVAMEIPVGYVGYVYPRSSICKTNLILSNSVGVIDSDYRGEIKFVFRRINLFSGWYNINDRIGQIVFMPIPKTTLVQVDTLSETVRNTGGYGSTGK